MSIEPTDPRSASTDGQPRLCRRTLFGGAGAVAAAAVLSACGAESEGTERASTDSAPAAPTTPPEPGPDATVVAAAADIPVGSGVLFADRRLVVTQPVAGTTGRSSRCARIRGATSPVSRPTRSSATVTAAGSVWTGP